MGQRIREYRTARNYSQRDFAAVLGVSPGTVANLERGWTYTPEQPIKPQRDTIVALAELLGIEEHELYEAYMISAPVKKVFDVTGLSVTDIERVKGYIDGLRQRSK